MLDLDLEKVNQAEVRKAVGVLFDDPDTVVELRVPEVPKAGTVSGYFDGRHRSELVEAACFWSGKGPGVYVTLNPVQRDLLARCANRVKAFTKFATGNADIVCRRWFPLDFDPVKVPGISANDAE